MTAPQRTSSREVAIIVAAQIIGMLGTAAVVLLGPRGLTEQQLSSFLWTTSWVVSLSAVAHLGGVTLAVVRNANEHPARPLQGVTTPLLATLVGLTLAASAWLIGLGDLASGSLGDGFSSSLVLAWLLIAAPADVLSGVLRGRQRYGRALLTGETLRRGMTAVAFGLAFAGVDAIAGNLVRFILVAEVVAFVAMLAWALRSSDTSGNYDSVATHLRSCRHYFPIALASMVLPHAGPWITGLVISDPSSVTAIGLAVRLAAFAGMPLFMANRLLTPKIAACATTGNMGELQASTSLAVVSASLTALASLIVVVLGGSGLIGFIFGEGQEAAFWPVVIMLATAVIHATTGLCGAALTATGHAIHPAGSGIAAAIAFVALGTAAGAAFGVNGVAAAALVLTGVQNAYLHLRARQLVDLDVSLSVSSLRGATTEAKRLLAASRR